MAVVAVVQRQNRVKMDKNWTKTTSVSRTRVVAVVAVIQRQSHVQVDKNWTKTTSVQEVDHQPVGEPLNKAPRT